MVGVCVSNESTNSGVFEPEHVLFTYEKAMGRFFLWVFHCKMADSSSKIINSVTTRVTYSFST